MKTITVIAGSAVLALAFPAFAHASGGAIVEEIVARVNNDIITLSDYEKAEASLHDDAQQACQGCTDDKINEMVADEKKNLLRDLINQSLLVQRAKDLDITGETDLVKRLDQIRQQNNLPSMDALQQAVESSGISWEDYKQRMLDEILKEKVIQQEVGPTVKIGNDEVQKYYEAHKSDFVKPEEVDISEIFLSTENKTPQDIDVIKAKAAAIEQRLKQGEDFAALARKFSEDTAASAGGEVGEFQPGMMTPDIQKAVFALKQGDSTDVMPVKNGLEIYHVNQRFEAGLQPLSKVEDEIENQLYQDRLGAAMQKYEAQLRHDSYIRIAAGYTDTAAVAGNTVIQEVPFGTDKAKNKKSIPRSQLPTDEDDNQ